MHASVTWRRNNSLAVVWPLCDLIAYDANSLLSVCHVRMPGKFRQFATSQAWFGFWTPKLVFARRSMRRGPRDRNFESDKAVCFDSWRRKSYRTEPMTWLEVCDQRCTTKLFDNCYQLWYGVWKLGPLFSSFDSKTNSEALTCLQGSLVTDCGWSRGLRGIREYGLTSFEAFSEFFGSQG